MRLLLLFALTGAGSAETPAKHLNFTACPIAQDQGPDRDMCFYTEYRGQKYTLSFPQDWGAPQLGHKVLVEAAVVDKPGDCGGLSIDGRVSVMPELSLECNTIAPLLPTIKQPELSPAQAAALEKGLAEIAADPRLSLRSIPLPTPQTPEAKLGRLETVYFPWDSDRATGPDAFRMVSMAKLAQATRNARVEITAYAGQTLLDDGTILAEPAKLAQQRADKMVGIFKGLGAENARYKVVIAPTDAADGKEDWRSRRVEFRIQG